MTVDALYRKVGKHLQKLNKQRAFDRVRRHLLEQGGPCLDEGGRCMYRGPNGMKCAIGVLIPDSLYHPALENEPVLAFLNGESDFFTNLQEIHDNKHPSTWETHLREFAERWGLKCR